MSDLIVEPGDVKRCPKCNLVQFLSPKRRCKRCHTFLVPPIPTEPKPRDKASVIVAMQEGLAATVKKRRMFRGLSQKTVARISGLPRTYVSRIENSRITPTLHNLERLCRGIGIPMSDLFSKVAVTREDDLFEAAVVLGLRRTNQLYRDGFRARILDYVREAVSVNVHVEGVMPNGS